MKAWQENFDELKNWQPRFKMKFVELLARELIDPKYSTLDVNLKIKKNEFLQDFLPVYFDVQHQQYDSVTKIESLYKTFSQQSPEANALLQAVFNSTFEKHSQSPLSWDYELDIPPTTRYLIIKDKISFTFPVQEDFITRERYNKHSEAEFTAIKQEFNSFLREQNNQNLLSLGISYSYAEILLPKTYDIIFDTQDLTRFWRQKTIVRYAFNNRNYFHTELWRGHHSHCFIEVIGDIPDIFNELPVNDGGRTQHKGIGLCTGYDWQYIQNK